ncbi:hypothetical protein G7054_g8513 [Neopestalotiopsis clavispora]|nr:hypothetical protein G7054_g8513 [Neopestalotiopsis clavispora]
MATTPIPSSPSRLETLPTVLLDFICEHLANCDLGRKSLFAFSLVSKHCCTVADRQRFERIQLQVRGSSELREDIERLTTLLEAKERFRHVRKVKVVGFMPPDSPGDEKYRIIAKQQAVEDFVREDREDRAQEVCYHDTFLDPPKCPLWVDNAELHLATPEAKQKHNEAWQPFARMIARLSRLEDLVYSCADQVPPCLLAALHQHHPQSRLHVHTFCLRSLLQKYDEIRDIDPDEYTLITSPCLYSIVLYTSAGYITTGHINYNREALFAMVSGVSPGLKYVRTKFESCGNSPYVLRAVREGRPEWRGFFMNNEGMEHSQGQLEGISIIGQSDMAGLCPSDWARVTDFHNLRSLELLAMALTPGSLDALLVCMDSSKQLRQLQRLSLEIDTDAISLTGLEARLAEFLERLPPLEELVISGPYGPQILSAITQHHGASLRKLELMPCEEGPRDSCAPTVDLRSQVYELQEHCPNLRQLTLMLPRSKGDEQELALYRALGRFKFLTHLSIILLCSNQQQMDPPSPEIARDAFINASVDASLARAIFNVICAANPSSPSVLRVMKTSVFLAGLVEYWYGRSFYRLMCWLGRSWLCQRYPRHDQTGEITVDEIDMGDRHTAWDEGMDDWDNVSHGEIYEQVWGELWPDQTDILVDKRSSFPLADISG